MTLPGFLSPTPDKELQLLHLSYSDDLVAGCNDGNHRRLPTGKYTHTQWRRRRHRQFEREKKSFVSSGDHGCWADLHEPLTFLHKRKKNREEGSVRLLSSCFIPPAQYGQGMCRWTAAAA